MALGETDRLEQLMLGERTDEEMGRTDLMKTVQRRRVGSRQEHEQGRFIRLDRLGDLPRCRLSLRKRAAGVDDRDGGARRDETRFDIVDTPGRDRLPAGGFRKPAELVAVTEGQDEERRGHARV